MPRKTGDKADMFLGLAVGGPAMIVAQEKQGQAELCRKEVLPTECGEECRRALESAGVVFGNVVEGDEMFRHVTLPSGWHKKPTDHSMYSHLVDERGRNRAAIFYKAAFYDRKANMYAVRCLVPWYVKDEWDDRESPVIPVIRDSNDDVLWRGRPITRKMGTRNGVFYSPTEDARSRAAKLLSKRYPDYESLTAYWDADSFEFPEWGSQPPKGERYKVDVSIYNESGRFVDGGMHADCLAESDEAAIEKLVAKVAKNLGNYARVECRILCGDRFVGQRTVSKPLESRYGPDGYCERWRH